MPSALDSALLTAYAVCCRYLKIAIMQTLDADMGPTVSCTEKSESGSLSLPVITLASSRNSIVDRIYMLFEPLRAEFGPLVAFTFPR
jgi:hypothetical protein